MMHTESKCRGYDLQMYSTTFFESHIQLMPVWQYYFSRYKVNNAYIVPVYVFTIYN